MQRVRWIHVIAVIGLALGFCGCESSTGTANSAATNGQVSDRGPSAESQESFLAAYRAAHERKDLEGLLKLYCWDDVPADLRETIRGNVQDQLLQSITNIALHPLDAPQSGETQEGDRRWRPNLAFTHMLKVEFSNQGSFGLTSIEAGVGQKRGRYLLVVSVPVR